MTFSSDILDSKDASRKVVALHGELDESVLDSLKKSIDPFLNDSACAQLIFDLSDLEFVNSKGIGFIVSIHTHLSKDHRKLVLVGAQEAVMDVITLVGLTSILPYFATLDEALA